MTTTTPPSAPEPLDLAAIRARAARHTRLERDAGRDITLAEVSAAICSADDVPMLLGEIGRLTRMVGEAHRTIRSLLAMDELDADSLDEPDEPDIPTRLGQVSEGLCRQPNPDGQLCAYERPCPHHDADPATERLMVDHVLNRAADIRAGRRELRTQAGKRTIPTQPASRQESDNG